MNWTTEETLAAVGYIKLVSKDIDGQRRSHLNHRHYWFTNGTPLLPVTNPNAFFEDDGGTVKHRIVGTFGRMVFNGKPWLYMLAGDGKVVFESPVICEPDELVGEYVTPEAYVKIVTQRLLPLRGLNDDLLNAIVMSQTGRFKSSILKKREEVALEQKKFQEAMAVFVEKQLRIIGEDKWTELDALIHQYQVFDHYYGYSDDLTVWRTWSEKERVFKETAKNLGIPDLWDHLNDFYKQLKQN